MRKERKDAVYAAEERKQMILEFVVGTLAAVIGAVLKGGIVY